MKILPNHPVANTFGFPVRARRVIEMESEADLPELSSLLAGSEGESLCIAGRGSNLLFLGDYGGTVLHSAIAGISVLADDGDSVTVEAGSGVVWDDLVAWTVERGLWGAENLSAIPGEAGAAAVQNIGAYGVEAADLIREVRVWDIGGACFRSFPVGECGYGYRESVFKNPPLHNRVLVTRVTLCLSRTPRPQLGYGNLREAVTASVPDGGITPSDVREAVIRIRAGKLPDPARLGNAGSFFKNPVIPRAQYEGLRQQYPAIPSYPAGEGLVKVPAAWLIEQCGWKGVTRRGAGVYERQPLVLVNHGTARPSDIAALARDIIGSVSERFQITISPEVNYIE